MIHGMVAVGSPGGRYGTGGSGGLSPAQAGSREPDGSAGASAGPDVVVVGGGAAGLAAVSTTRAAGYAVTLVSDGPLGGDCTWHGCVPTKSLLEAARAGATAADAVRHARSVVRRIARTENEHALRTAGAEVVRARAVLRGGGRVTLPDGRLLSPSTGVVLATGSRPVDLAGLPELLPTGAVLTDTDDWLDAVEAHLDSPGDVVVVGGGTSGVELAQALGRLGAAGPGHRVRLLEQAAELLPGVPGSGAVVAAALRADGVDVVTGAGRTELVAATSPGCLVLVAAGREPVLDVLGADAGVEVEAGAVVVDPAMRTTAARVCAAGDLTGLRPSTHVSVATGRVAAATLLGRDVSFDPAWVPQVVYTDPQVAMVGEVPGEPGTRSVRVPLSRSDRAPVAAVPGRRDRSRGGFAQVWVQAEADGGFGRGGRLAGALLVGPHVGELVGEVAMAGRLGLSVEEWVGGRVGLGALAAQHAYPTWSWLWDTVAERLLRPA